jgi:hypothetical protein
LTNLTVDDALLMRSSLTAAQVECMMLHSKVLQGEFSSLEAASRRGAGVSLGAYYRVLKQGRRNITCAMFTILLSVRMGVVRLDDVRRLLDLGQKLQSGVEAEKIPEVISLLDALVKRLVMS